MAPEETQPEHRTNSPLLTVADAAIRLNTTQAHIKNLIRNRVIAVCRVGRFWRFHPADLDWYLESTRLPALLPREARTTASPLSGGRPC